MNIRCLCGIAAGKAVLWACRFLQLGGTTLPGKVALTVCPDLLSKLSRGYRIIVVTGTNGKTTTSRIISRILDECGIPHISNRSGANLFSGVTSTFLEYSSFRGKRAYDTAVLEIDEAAVKVVCDHIQPSVITVTNFFRDQLDRYGELYTTVANVRSAVSKSPEAIVVINADDSLSVSLTAFENIDNRIVYYGVNGAESLKNADRTDIVNSDAPFCIRCKGAYLYDYITYGHLGGFKCPSCGYSRPEPDIWCDSSILQDDTGSECELRLRGDETGHKVRIPLPALYNVYNAIAAAATAFALQLPLPAIMNGLGSFECGFGRMERIETDRGSIRLILVKNPAGFNQVIDFLTTGSKRVIIAFLLNDRIADGTDVSWIWDVDFEKLGNATDRTDKLYASGDRAEDIALRLKYAGMDQDRIVIVKDYVSLIGQALADTGPGGVLYILPTYTAMLDLRRILKRHYNLKEFWK